MTDVYTRKEVDEKLDTLNEKLNAWIHHQRCDASDLFARIKRVEGGAATAADRETATKAMREAQAATPDNGADSVEKIAGEMCLEANRWYNNRGEGIDTVKDLLAFAARLRALKPETPTPNTGPAPDSVEKIADFLELNHGVYYKADDIEDAITRLRALKADRNPTDKNPAEKHKIEIVGTLPIGWKEIRFDGGVHHWFCTEGHLFAMKSLALALGIEVVEKP